LEDTCPDCIFPASNSEGVADLLPTLQGDFFDYPLAWGSVRRTGDYRGRTILFYIDDYRFAALGNAIEYGSHFRQLWERPDKVWQSGAPSFVEANFSTSNSQPRWRALEQIGKKRYLSRYFQERGMRCWVDLNVAPRWWDINLLGLPLGWKAYATRIEKNSSLQSIMDQASLAESQAGTDAIRFVVYGHRQEMEDLCKKEGWIYVDEQSSIWDKRESNKARKASMQIEVEQPRNQRTLMEMI